MPTSFGGWGGSSGGGGGGGYRGAWDSETSYGIGDSVSHGAADTYYWPPVDVYAKTSHTRYCHAVISSIDSSNSTHNGILVQPATSYTAMHGAAGNDWRIILASGSGTLSVVINASQKIIAVSNVSATTTLTALAAALNANANLTAQVLPWSEGTYRPLTGTYKFTGGANESYSPVTQTAATANVGSVAAQAETTLGSLDVVLRQSGTGTGIIRVGPGTAISAADAPNWTINYSSAQNTNTVTLNQSTKTITAVMSSNNVQGFDDAWTAKGFTATMLVPWANGGFAGSYSVKFGANQAALAVRSARAAGLSSNQYRVKFQRGTQPVLNAQASQTFDSGSDQKTLTVRNISGQTGAASNNFLVKFERGNQVVAAVKAAASIRGSGSFDTVGVDVDCRCSRYRRQRLQHRHTGQFECRSFGVHQQQHHNAERFTTARH